MGAQTNTRGYLVYIALYQLQMQTITATKLSCKYYLIPLPHVMSRPKGGPREDTGSHENSVEKELSRLLKNQDRRQVREKQGKGKKKNASTNVNTIAAASPDASGDKASGGTTRKCANCGQVGHIKTNKRYWHYCHSILTSLSPGIPMPTPKF